MFDSRKKLSGAQYRKRKLEKDEKVKKNNKFFKTFFSINTFNINQFDL